MITLLLTFALIKDAVQTNAGSAQEQTVERCRVVLARKVKGEISNFIVTTTSRHRGYTTLTGTVSILKRPNSQPGELTPSHVQRIDSSFRCRLRGRSSTRVTITPNAE
jgi:hypothetical protein